MPGLDS